MNKCNKCVNICILEWLAILLSLIELSVWIVYIKKYPKSMNVRVTNNNGTNYYKIVMDQQWSRNTTKDSVLQSGNNDNN